MGISHVEAWALTDAIRAGVRFQQTATIGRQNLHASSEQLRLPLAAAGVSRQKQEEFFAAEHLWAEELFRLLGAENVTSFDASDYEQATVVHDFNEPIPRQFVESFDFVYDGGTLEHVFHVPTALRSEMEMTRVGGHLLIAVPANNAFGHGFYQFSPELLYRVLSPENGFAVVAMTLTSWLTGQRFAASDPAEIGRRLEFYATEPSLMLCVLAQRTAQKPIFARAPAQSDYSARWTQSSSQGTSSNGHNTASNPNGTSPSGSTWRKWLSRIGQRWFPRLLNYVRRKRSQRLSAHPDLFPPRPPER